MYECTVVLLPGHTSSCTLFFLIRIPGTGKIFNRCKQYFIHINVRWDIFPWVLYPSVCLSNFFLLLYTWKSPSWWWMLLMMMMMMTFSIVYWIGHAKAKHPIHNSYDSKVFVYYTRLHTYLYLLWYKNQNISLS